MSEHLEALGYMGAFIGAIVEGEVCLISALQTARLGHTDFYGILLAAFLGTQTIDWSLYLSARRWKDNTYFDRKPALRSKLDRMSGFLHHYPEGMLLTYRFMYGFRVVLPLLFGISRIPIFKFALYSFIGTLLWITVVASIGCQVLHWLGGGVQV